MFKRKEEQNINERFEKFVKKIKKLKGVSEEKARNIAQVELLKMLIEDRDAMTVFAVAVEIGNQGLHSNVGGDEFPQEILKLTLGEEWLKLKKEFLVEANVLIEKFSNRLFKLLSEKVNTEYDTKTEIGKMVYDDEHFFDDDDEIMRMKEEE